MKIVDGKKVIWETENFLVVAVESPFISREEGGHMMVMGNGNKYRYDSRLDFSPKEILEQQILCQMICEAYKIAMEKRNIQIIRINFFEAGNWAWKKDENGNVSKAYYHEHIFGRTVDAKKQKFPDAPYLPDRKTIRMKCSRAVADEARTHITLSSLMKSTRYCNFRNKFNVVKPYWYDQNDLYQQMAWVDAVRASEEGYYKMLDLGLNPQEARGVLPLDIETELLLCGFTNQKDEGWDRFLKLRTDKAAHPDIQILANQIKK